MQLKTDGDYMIKQNTDYKTYSLWLTIYLGVLIFGIFQHEFWMDESHHWLIARDSNSISELVKNYEYDGHPLIWVILMWFISQFTANIIFIKLLHVVIATITAGVFLFHAPFKKGWKILFLFSYYFVFEYSIISRNYGISILFLLLFSVAYSKNKSSMWPLIFLGLAANSHLFAFILSLPLFLKLLFEQKQINYIKKTSLIYLPLIIIAFFSIKAPSNHFFYFDLKKTFDIKRLAQVYSMFLKALIPFPDITEQSGWNSNLIITKLKWLSALPATLSWMIPYLLLKQKSGKLLFYGTAVLLGSFCLLTGLHISQRVCGFLLFFLIVLLWLERSSNQNNIPKLSFYNWFKPLKTVLISGFFLIQISSGLTLLIHDVKRPFSSTEQTYHYLKNEGYLEFKIYGGSYCNYIGLNNYGKIKLNIRENPIQTTFCDWRILNEKRAKQELEYALEFMSSQQLNQLIFLNPEPIDTNLVINQKIKLITSFTDGMINNENVYIYLIQL